MASPTVRRIQLGRELRRLRERAQVTREAARDVLECELTKISKIETGKMTTPAAEIKLLLQLYEASDDEREYALELGRQARKRTTYRVPDWARTFVGLEADATEIKTYEAELVPGLLQTEAYCRAVTREADPTRTPEEVERMVATRGERQARLTSDDAPHFWAVINEAVIKRGIGRPEVMAEQLERLLELGNHQRMSIQVLPFAAGAHPAMGSAFVILRLMEPPDTRIVYLEDLYSSDYVEREQYITAYNQLFDRLAVQAADPDDSAQMIRRELEGIR